MSEHLKEKKNPNYVDIQKEEIEEKIVEGLTSKELSEFFDVTQDTITKKVQKFWGDGLRTVRKQLYKKHHKYGSCKVCGDPLNPNQSEYCSNECKFADDEYNKARSTDQKNDENKKAVCVDCGYESDDYKNLSGSLTKHAKKHQNKSVDDLFRIEEKEAVNHLECPECDWKTTDLENQSGSFTKHVKETHGSILDFCEKHSDYRDILPYEKSKNKKRLEENGVECKICGKKFDKLTNTHLKKHDITPTEYKTKYESETYSEDHYDKCRDHYEKHLEGNDYVYVSEAEKEIKQFLEKLNIENVKTTVRNLDGINEIDHFLPDYNLGIEYNGLRYHSEKFNNKGREYHYNKNRKCEELGINLIQVFSDQWNYKKEIVKSRLKHKLGKDIQNRVGGRECEVVRVENQKKRKFLNQNHLRGTVGTSVSLGLKHEDDLLALMTFGHSRSNYEYELSRFAIKKGFVVYGAAGKLFSHFLENENQNSVVTYVDLCWSSRENNFYSKIGFEFDGEVSPTYFYTKNYHRRIHKSNFSKKNIKEKYPEEYDSNLTEWGNMQKLGYDRIWDSGKLRYIWQNE